MPAECCGVHGTHSPQLWLGGAGGNGGVQDYSPASAPVTTTLNPETGCEDLTRVEGRGAAAKKKTGSSPVHSGADTIPQTILSKGTLNEKEPGLLN